jgi:hypothetical protein
VQFLLRLLLAWHQPPAIGACRFVRLRLRRSGYTPENSIARSNNKRTP